MDLGPIRIPDHERDLVLAVYEPYGELKDLCAKTLGWLLLMPLIAEDAHHSGFEPHIDFLRNLQNLRSSGAAHRKGSNYRKIADEFQVDRQNLRTVFDGILRRALDVLNFLISAVENGAFKQKDPD